MSQEQRSVEAKLEVQPKQQAQDEPVLAEKKRSSSFQESHSVSYESSEESGKSQDHASPHHDGKDQERRIKYKYCCKVCKHTDSTKKACVCVVPLDQRRTAIGDQGCQTCGCNGCSKEDFLSRGEDPQYKPGQKYHHKAKKQKELTEFEARNGCCRKCMKAFSKSNKSCLCQVPEEVRNTKLPSSGCKICGCFGCNPEDKKDPKVRKPAVRKDRSRSREKRKRSNHRSRSSSSSESREYIDSTAMNFYNIEKSAIGNLITKEYRLDLSLLGFGIPQRTQSYITGRPK